jgi:predicted GNAT superfamily acetyltransferase
MQPMTCAEVTFVMGGRLLAMSPADLLRPMTDDDVPRVLELNRRHVELLSPLDAERLSRLRSWASRADVILCDGEVAGFVLVFSPGSAYDSENYRWFSDRYGHAFDYLDRIVVDDAYRRRGLASAVYDVVEEAAADRGRLVLEVNIDPPNEPSLAFHRARGFVEVHQLGASGHIVSLMERTGRSNGRESRQND